MDRGNWETVGGKMTEIGFITCVNDFDKYEENVRNSVDVFGGKCFPIDNRDNRYSAAQALNVGLKECKADIIVCCHQDVKFPEDWLKKVTEQIIRAHKDSKRIGVFGTAGVTDSGKKHGFMQDGNYGYWNENEGPHFGRVQTLDESCFGFLKSFSLTFDETFNHFHFYGADLCLQALNKGMINYGIDAPIIHYSGGGDSSMGKGRPIFEREMRKLKSKWIKVFPKIWTTTCILYSHKEVVLADYIVRKGKS